jgi:hypothetical protein
MKLITKTLFLLASTFATISCSDSKFQGGGSAKDPEPTPSATPADNIGEIVTNGFSERGVDENKSEDSTGIFVPLTVSYEGENSGDDAQFTFYVARVAPVQDKQEKEIIKSKRKTFFKNSVPDICKCGSNNEMMFLWRHVRGRAGALHTRTEGEWLVAKDVSTSKWKTKGLKAIPVGPQTIFLGADTENPNFLSDPTGQGYFRTENYAPNSILGNSKKWENRDDMRLSLTCEVDSCPENLRAGTAIDLKRDASMNP